MEREDTREAIQRRRAADREQSYPRDWIYCIDGRAAPVAFVIRAWLRKFAA